MKSRSLHFAAIATLAMAFAVPASPAATPRLEGVGTAMQSMIDHAEIAGAVTCVVSPRSVLHLEAVGFADVAAPRPMAADTLFWIASMTKPVTATAILMLQDEGRLHVDDPVERYLPEFSTLRTPSGQPARLTISQLLTHTSGLGEAAGPAAGNAKTLADLVPLWVAAPMQFEPGAKWAYCQSSINAAARVVEVVGGMPFEIFLEKRIFKPLGMRDTTFYPDARQRQRLVTAYARDAATGKLNPVPHRQEFGTRNRPPLGNGGLFSTAPDYARFCQMLLGNGSFRGRRILSPEAVRFLNTPRTGDLETGFFRNDTFGQHGTKYGWGVGTCVLKTPHPGAAEALSPGSFGHGGAWGTQAWVDPLRGVAYILMVQRSNFPNSDASEVRRVFQNAATTALR